MLVSLISLPVIITLFETSHRWRSKVSMGIGKYWRHPSFNKLVSQCQAYSPRLKENNYFGSFFNSAQSQQFTQLSSLLFGAYPLSLSNLMYSLYKSLNHLTNLVIEKSLTSFILVYYIKVFLYAVGFANFFGSAFVWKGRCTSKEGGRDTNGQSGRNRHNQLTTALVY